MVSYVVNRVRPQLAERRATLSLAVMVLANRFVAVTVATCLGGRG